MQTALLRLSTVVALTSLGGACMTWKTEQATPREILMKEKHQQVRVTRAAGDTLILSRPSLEGDVVVGSRDSAAGGPAGRTEVPLSDIRSLAVRRTHGGKTALLVGGVGLAALVFLAAATYEGPFESTAP